MYSRLEAANKESSCAPGRAHLPVAGLGRSGGNSITAGCYVAGTTGAITPGVLSTGAGAAQSVTYAAENAGARPALLGVDNSASRKRAHPGPDFGLMVTGPQRNKAKGQSQRDSTSHKRTAANKQQQQQQQQWQPFEEFRTGGSTAASKFFNNDIPVSDIADADERCSALLRHSNEKQLGGLGSLASATWSPFREESTADGVFSIASGAMQEYGEGGQAEPTDPELLGPPPDTGGHDVGPATVSELSAVPASLRVTPSGSNFSFRTPGPTSFLTSNNTIEEHPANRVPPARQQSLSDSNGGGATATKKKKQQMQQIGDKFISNTKPSSNRHPKPHLQKGGNPKTAHNSPFLSRQLDGIYSAYSNQGGDGAPSVPSASIAATKKKTVVEKKRGGKRARGGGGGGGGGGRDDNKNSGARTRAGVHVIHDATGGNGSSTARWKHGGNSAAVVAAARAAERMRQLEELMNAAMGSPVTYEEQIRRERLAHLRMMYTVSWAEKPISAMIKVRGLPLPD